MTAVTMAGRFPLAVANKSEPWKAGRAVGTTCACASAYGRRDAPSPVGLCLLCLDLSVSCVSRLRARVFHAQRRSRHFVFDTKIKSQPARTLHDIKCVAALLIRPRKVTQVYTYTCFSTLVSQSDQHTHSITE